MEGFREKQPSGSLQISRDVITTIAGICAQEIDGVNSLAPYTPLTGRNMVSKMNSKPVSAVISEGIAELYVGVALDYGAKIGEVCTAVQKAVKENVQTMTGMAVSKVNVFVARIVFENEGTRRENTIRQ